MTGALPVVSHAQANSLKQISFFIDRSNPTVVTGYQSGVKLVGDNINVIAEVWQQTAPLVCAPCFPNSTLDFQCFLDNEGFIRASGTIDGIFYPALYVFHGLHFRNPDNTKIPKLWSKTVRISAPVTVSGYVGIWRTQQEVGINDKALHLHNGINFTGRVKLILRTVLDSNTRFYRDKYFSADFAAAP